MTAKKSRSAGAQKKNRRKRATNKRRALVVLGMHRSGTSAMTQMLGLLGATLPKNLMPPTESNPRGYFESQTLFELHEELMHDAGTSWFDLTPFPEDWVESPLAAGWIDRLAAACLEEFEDSPFFVLKDPRVVRLLPVWTQVFDQLDVEPSFVLTVRNPLDVAASLKRSQDTDEAKGLLLWLQYFLAAEYHTRGSLRCFQSYEALLDDWREVADRIAKGLHIVFPRRSRHAAAEIDAFLTTDLQHQVTAREQVAARHDVVDWVKEVYEWSCEAVSGKVGNTRRLDRIRGAFESVEAACGPLIAKVELDRARSDRRAGQLETEVIDLRGALSQSNHEAEQIAKQLDVSREQLSARGTEVGEIRDQLSAREEEGTRLVELVKFVLEAALGQLDEAATRKLSMEYGGGVLAPLAETGLQLSLRAGELELLREDVASLREQVMNAEEIERMKHESAERASAVSRLSAEVGELRDRVGRRDTAIEHLKEESAEQVLELGREKLAGQTLTQQIVAQQAQTSRLEQDLQRSSADAVNRSQEIAENKTALARAGGEVSEFKQRLEIQEKQVSGLERELQRSAAKAELRSRELALEKVERAKARTEADDLQQLLVGRDAQIIALQQDLENTTTEVADQSQKLAVEKAETAKARKEADDQQQLLVRRDAQIIALHQDLESTTTAVADRSRELAVENGQHAKTRKEADDLHERLGARELQIEELARDVQSSSVVRAAQQTKLEDKDRNLAAIRGNLQQAEMELAAARTFMANQRQRLEARVAGLEQDLRHSTAEVGARSREVASDKALLAARDAELETKTHELGVAREKLQRLQTELEKASDDVADREFCAQQLRNQLDAPPKTRRQRLISFSGRS